TYIIQRLICVKSLSGPARKRMKTITKDMKIIMGIIIYILFHNLCVKNVSLFFSWKYIIELIKPIITTINKDVIRIGMFITSVDEKGTPIYFLNISAIKAKNNKKTIVIPVNIIQREKNINRYSLALILPLNRPYMQMGAAALYQGTPLDSGRILIIVYSFLKYIP